ncbi:hypothetical protein ACP70R_041279 [Stipagrostis hirtigluma subsp. patula]
MASNSMASIALMLLAMALMLVASAQAHTPPSMSNRRPPPPRQNTARTPAPTQARTPTLTPTSAPRPAAASPAVPTSSPQAGIFLYLKKTSPPQVPSQRDQCPAGFNSIIEFMLAAWRHRGKMTLALIPVVLNYDKIIANLPRADTVCACVDLGKSAHGTSAHRILCAQVNI